MTAKVGLNVILSASVIVVIFSILCLTNACMMKRNGLPPRSFTSYFDSPMPPDSVCYPGIGCFLTNHPFKDLPPPQNPDKMPPTFYILELNETRDGIVARQIFNASQLNVTNLVVMTHGFTGDFNGTKEWNEPLTVALYERDPTYTVLFIEWAVGAKMCFDPLTNIYSQPASNTRSIAAANVNFLRDHPDFNITQAYCIGFSLGAHVCSFMSKYARQKWARLSAIDPAAPLFNKEDHPEARVDKSDGLFVDVLHTSRMGISFNVGHVDFFVNSIRLQPGCEKEFMPPGTPSWLMGEIMAYFACGHYRAPRLFAASINPTDPQCDTTYKFCPCEDGDITKVTRNCDSNNTQVLGFHSIALPDRGGAYCGVTTSEPPYCS